MVYIYISAIIPYYCNRIFYKFFIAPINSNILDIDTRINFNRKVIFIILLIARFKNHFIYNMNHCNIIYIVKNIKVIK